MAQKTGYSLYFVTPQSPGGVWFDLTPGIRDLDRSRTSLNQYIPLPHGEMYRGLNGEGLGSIQVSGTFGMRVRKVGAENMTGTQALQYLEKLIDQYWEATKGKDTERARKAIVEWHDWDDDHHLYVEPGDLNATRGPSNKIHRIYSLRLESYGKIQRKLTAAVESARSKADQYLKDMKAATKKIQDAANFLQKKQAAFKEILDKYVIRPLNDIINATSDFVTGLSGWIDIPFQVVLDLGNNINAAIQTITDWGAEQIVNLAMRLRQVGRMAVRMTNTFVMLKPTYEQAAQEFSFKLFIPFADDDTDLERDAKSGGTNASRIQRAISLSQVSAQGARKAQVLSGDTLQIIAARELGDVDRWFEISVLNGYLDNDDLATATEILIPAQPTSGGLVNQQLSSTSFLSLDERLYGRDLRTIVTSRGKLSVVFGTFDLATVAGKDNLLQALRHSDMIQQGTLLENLDYGIRAIVGSSQTRQDAAALAWSLRETAQADPRIESCEVQVSVGGNVTYYERTITPVGSTASIPAGAVTAGV